MITDIDSYATSGLDYIVEGSTAGWMQETLLNASNAGRISGCAHFATLPSAPIKSPKNHPHMSQEALRSFAEKNPAPTSWWLDASDTPHLP